MAALELKLTNAGLAAVQGASGSDPVILSHLGLSATPFAYAPTLTALPGEFKRVVVESGIAAAPNITHLTAYDTSGDVWSMTGFGLFMDDGVLFAVHTSPDVVMSKAGPAFALIALDIAFEADLAASISYGNAVFTYPPATESMRGVAEIATQAEVDAGTDDARFVTVLKLANRLLPLIQSIANEAQARGNADAALNAAIGNEGQARINGDNGLIAALNVEAAARHDADVALQADINTRLPAAAYTAADVLAKLLTVDGTGSGLDADLLDGHDAADYDRIAQSNLVANGGFEVFASGKKVTWGQITIGQDAYAVYNLPVGHQAWVHPTFGLSTEAANTQIQQNTGITAILTDGNGAPTGIRFWNADDRLVTIWVRTIGV
ncbi:hypothetical protein [Novosphingobium sp. Leaf2]|uniref:hypothetical protein n=1 Tax=Novosphingobium sp. Leaf2 TaxID=1735670 RepID=UPI0006FF4F57|nr:hypothetical protein [Novosphingobium sp. Leaf2]KQM21945.1 hypothetical protein ASE49_01130 [Novosphingobium sp. Leaf2]